MKYPRAHILRFIACMILLSSTLNGISQEYNSARLTVLYGSTIPFNFNSITKIKNGIEIVNGTKLGITLVNNSVEGTALKGFQLNFNSFNNQTKIKGDAYELDLDLIRVKAENALGLESGVSSDPLYQQLTASPVNLFTYIQDPWMINLKWNTHQLNISYDCGREPGRSLMGAKPDFYTVEIEFELIPVGDGF